MSPPVRRPIATDSISGGLEISGQVSLVCSAMVGIAFFFRKISAQSDHSQNVMVDALRASSGSGPDLAGEQKNVAWHR